MRMVEIKKQSEAELEGVNVEVDFVDNSAKGVTIVDAKGKVLRVFIDSYAVKIVTNAPPKTKRVFVVSGNISGARIREIFEDEYDAQKLVNSISSCGDITMQEEEVPDED